jgi:hypothetical protein
MFLVAKKLLNIVIIKKYFLVIALSSLAFAACSNTSGPSCTLWTNATCFDYAGVTDDAYKTSAEDLCNASLGIWSTDGCPYENCGTADANGQIECTE